MPRRSAEIALLRGLAARSDVRERQGDELRRLAAASDWQWLQASLAAQKLLPLVGRRLVALAGAAVPSAFAGAVEAEVALHRMRGMLLSVRTLELVGRLEGEGVRALPLKGALLGERLYGDPGMRPSSDVDLLVDAARWEQARAVLEGHGYVAEHEPAYERGLPLLHDVLRPSSDHAPTVELHWRIHWYEAEFSRRMLERSERDERYGRLATPADDLFSLLLFYARDGMRGLRLSADIAAWWDLHGDALEREELDRLLAQHPALRPSAFAAADACVALGALPEGLLTPSARPHRRLERLATALGDPDLLTDEAEAVARITLVDLVLSPRGGRRAFVRRHLLRPPSAIARDYGIEDAPRAVRIYRYLSHSVRVTAKLTGRWALLVWRHRRS